MAELQDDLLIEILARLPVKSLIRFTCVCKYWLSLIRSPEFATKHYSTRLELDSVLGVFEPGCSISILSYDDLTYQTTSKFRPAVDYQPPRFRIHHRDVISDLYVFGPCNGLFLINFSRICFRYGGDDDDDCSMVLLLWNPATREVFKLPNPTDFRWTCLGFGFDCATNDYKIVSFNGNNSGSTRPLQLYSLASNSWRKLDDGCFTGRVESYAAVPSSNGRKFHWMLYDIVRYEVVDFLLSFDMVDEVFVQTPVPTDATSCHFAGFLYQGSSHMYPTVCFQDRCIPEPRGLHIWSLKGYGPTGVWTKQHYIRLPDMINNSQKVLWKSKAILTTPYEHHTVTLYDLTTQEIRSLGIPSNNHLIGYTESLISIAKLACRQPSIDCSSLENVPLQGGQGGSSIESNLVHHQHEEEEDSTIEVLFQQLVLEGLLVPENHEDDDDSSTDSAFLTPEGPSFLEWFSDPEDDYVVYHKIYPLRNHEWERLCKLPYCLREVNQPLISNPCTF